MSELAPGWVAPCCAPRHAPIVVIVEDPAEVWIAVEEAERELTEAISRGWGARMLLCDVASLNDPDLFSLDALARLKLAAGRLGCRLRLEHVPGRLQSLLEFSGLAGTIACSGVEMVREAEEREERIGVEEERDTRDLPT